MASVYDLKPKFQQLLRPTVQQLAERGITANQVTLAACALSIAVGAILAWLNDYLLVFLLLPLTMFARMALNAIDGMLAREHHMASKKGAVLNELCDVISDAALYLPFAYVLQPEWIVGIVVLAVISEMTGVVAIQVGAERRYDGPMGKSDRAVVFGTLGFIMAVGIPFESWVNTALAIVIGLLCYTIFNRARRALVTAAD